ncbi:transcriptional repressor KorB C-terminal beta-barrel domain-containing protein [uncultured Parasutterella sp.]|uniref:transcriptional repressor KorB C-terminal beta-barrel domain-containing protein n=1 Tax=uncultured Parasutterella sp. TaxID=1263098 RepID=UPI0026207CFA|nr:transcriptional repressor KorB C-terminal beta-barrel domain-containing protein [uncultured Parasutterella sp.]
MLIRQKSNFATSPSTKPDEENFNDPIAQKDFLETEESLSHEQNEELKDGQGEFLDKKTIAEESHAENEELFPGAKIDESCYQPLEDQNEIDNEQEENAEEAFKESPSEDSFDDVDASVESFPDEEEKEQLYKKPIIFCLVDGRECELLYKRKASDGIVCVKFEDGSEQEVIAEKVQLNRICES